MEKHTVRVMTAGDYEELVRLWKETKGMGLRSLDDSREGIELFLKRNPETCFVALDRDRITGGILCGHDGRRGYIYHTVVRESERKKGIGSALVEAAVAALQREGITRVCLNVMGTNEQGKAFWESLGWERKDFLDFYSRSITEKENLPLFEVK